eukprot:TRINITY_DN54015_c0_g1_i1.p2 TRINITY_DN54015_c0_g1~~TRINITY_DN54015_c0_g1_i1.p2  ORF type:complete len:334 (+),score=65.92 TRINITY_DN54015_c0_g1_i1:118-1119(+)
MRWIHLWGPWSHYWNRGAEEELLPVVRSLATAAFYCFASTFMTVTNKWLVSRWGFNYNSTILLGQMVVSVLALLAMRARRVTDFPKFDRTLCWHLLPLSAFYVGNTFFALTALRLTSVPVYNVLKRMLPLPTMVFDWLLRDKSFSFVVKGSVAVLVFGALVTGWGDLDLNFWGYCFALTSCVLQALYLVQTSKAHDLGLRSDGILAYSSMLSLPMLLIMVLVFDAPTLAEYPHYRSMGFQLCLVSCMVMGSVLNYALFLCTTTNSAVTTAVVGQLKAALSTIAGFFLFERVNLSGVGLLGIFTSTFGGCMYAWAKFQEQRKRSLVREQGVAVV